MMFDASTPPATCPESGPAVVLRAGQEWRTTEVAILRQHYGTSGAKAVQALLPHRPIHAIRAKAASLGIKGIRKTTQGKRWSRLYPQRDDIDAMVREGYINATRKGDIKALAERIGRPAWWVQKRAALLGVTRTNRTRVDTWTAPELAILEEFAATGLDVIAKKLRAAGYTRTPTGIAVQLKRRSIDRTDPDTWSATQLGPLFGVNPSTVATWIERRGLPAKKTGEGVRCALLVHRRELRKWIKANPGFVDLRRVDQQWFWDVMFGAA